VENEMEKFLKQESFQSLTELEVNEVMDVTGFYALRAKNISMFPEPFRTELKKRKTNLIYIGKGLNIRKRLNQECRGISHGTFFRSLGAILGFRPPKGSLIGKTNQYNYKYCKEDRDKIVSWVNDNLEFSFVEVPREILNKESALIIENTPLLNIQHNPQALQELINLRENCRQYALAICEGKNCKK
jgi:hypothetical protein